MNNKQVLSEKQEEFIDYLIQHSKQGKTRIPSISEISKDLGISSACLREQLELAKNLGLIKIQPRKGIEILPYQFSPAVIKSLYYAIKLDRKYFDQFSELRNHLEKSFFIEAVKLLDEDDISKLNSLVESARLKLEGDPIQIPHNEHRKYHIHIYSKLNNRFLNGMLEAYWDTYELVGLDVYTDLNYLELVWDYHQQIIDAIEKKEIEKAYDLLIDHIQLIYQR